MMDSPEPSKNNGSSSASNLNNNTDASSSESPEVQESPFLRYVSTLSPITIRASHVAQGFLGLNSPPLVFKSPRISHRETQFMERPQGTQSLRGEISQTENGGNCLGEAPRDSRKSNSQQPLPGRSITAREAFDFKSEANTQNYSSLPSIDEYLADPGDIDQMYSADQDVEQSTDPACEPTQSKENILKFDRKDGPGDKAEESLPLSEDSNKVHQEKPAYSEELEKMEWEENDVEWSSQEPTKLESNLAADVFQKQYSHDPLPQDVKGCEDHNEMVSTSHVTAENISQDGSEATLKYHGIRRRCLQFGEVASNALGSNKSHVKVNQSATSSKMEIVKLSEPITCSFPQQGSANFPVTGPKPSGIGLHLNSIINAMPSGHAATTGVRLSDGLQGMKSTSSISIQRMENVNKSILLSNVDGQSLADTRNESREIDASVATDSFTSESPGMTEPIDDKRKLGPIDAGNSEEFNQPPSPGKKKKKTSVTGDNNDGKPCNCKKSKCVKLYCDCFGAGSYCSDSCACEGCLNRPQYAETVSESKQQIESRNPNAFAPKIVKPTTDISSNNIQEDKNLSTPASARHKRGCNCKRSMCAKKYCECYQANVGCSSGCRCEGCQNVHGKKGDYVALDKRVSSIVEKGSNSTFHNKLEMVASKTNYDLHCLSPITPSLQCSDQGKEAAKSRVISGNYLPCLESDVNMLASCANYPKSSANSHSSHALPETNEMLGAAPYDSQNNCNNANMMDQLSPTSNSLAVLLHLTPLSNSEPLSGAASFSSGASEWTSIPQSQLSRACIRQLPGGSLRWRSSPVTPSTRVGEAQPQYLQCPESDSRLFGILENETHYILNEASTPMRAIKVNSPTQKRISPPQSRHHGIGSCSSGGLRSGRKFILKSVPTFPPLTPCVDSKDTGNEELGDSES